VTDTNVQWSDVVVCDVIFTGFHPIQRLTAQQSHAQLSVHRLYNSTTNDQRHDINTDAADADAGDDDEMLVML